jgi:hypothetical protein
MPGRCNVGDDAPDTSGSKSPHGDEHTFDDRVMAVTAIDYSGHVLTVVSQSNVNGGSTQTAGVTPFMTIMFGGPLGQITWEADTWVNSLRNHEMAVCKLIESISSSGQD